MLFGSVGTLVHRYSKVVSLDLSYYLLYHLSFVQPITCYQSSGIQSRIDRNTQHESIPRKRRETEKMSFQDASESPEFKAWLVTTLEPM